MLFVFFLFVGLCAGLAQGSCSPCLTGRNLVNLVDCFPSGILSGCGVGSNLGNLYKSSRFSQGIACFACDGLSSAGAGREI